MEQVILIASFLIPLVLSLVIFFNSANNKPKRTLARSMLNAAAVFLANYFYFIQDFGIYVYIHSLHVALVLFIYPSLYIYLKQLTHNYAINYKTYIHILPGILFFLLYFLFFDVSIPQNEKITFLSNYREKSFEIEQKFLFIEWIRIINVAIIVVQVAGYSLAIFNISRKYHLKLKNELSNADDYQIKWLVWFNIGLIVVAVLSVMFYIVNPFSDTNNLLLIISMFSMSIFVWLIGIWGNAQKNIILPVLYEDNNYKTIENGELQIIYDNLVETINQSKIFTKPYLTLSELASNIGTNRTYISQAINLQGHMNFNAFINKFRINEAISILNKNPKIKIEELALMSGFGSVISFQRAFNKDIGKTLTEWKNRKE